MKLTTKKWLQQFWLERSVKLRLIWLELTTCHQIWTLDIFWTPRAITFCAEILEISRGPRSRKNLVFHANFTHNHAKSRGHMVDDFYRIGIFPTRLEVRSARSFQNFVFNSKTSYFIPKKCISIQNFVCHSQTWYFTPKLRISLIPKQYISFQNFAFHSKTSYFIPKLRISFQNTVFHCNTSYLKIFVIGNLRGMICSTRFEVDTTPHLDTMWNLKQQHAGRPAIAKSKRRKAAGYIGLG